MTDIIDLAKEILRLESDARLLYSPDLTIDLFKTYPLLAACISCKAVELAQMVIDKKTISVKYSLEYTRKAIEQARQEQKEKDAQIAEDFGEITVTKAIRESP